MTDHNNLPQNQLQHRLDDLMQDKPRMVVIGIGVLALIFFAVGGGEALEGFLTPLGYYQPDLTAYRVGMVVLAGVAGFGIGWFVSPAAKSARRILALVVVVIMLLLVIADHGILGWSAASILSWVLFFLGLGYWVRAVARRLSERPTTFGSGLWATIAYMLHHHVIGDIGFRLGFVQSDGIGGDLRYSGDRHMLTVAPNRSGKGTAAIIPNLLTYDGSVMVVDPKGENAMITAERRVDMGQDVHIVDPWGITDMEIARFNPMDWLVKGDIDIADNAMLLADAIIINMGESEQFWTEEAKALLLGAILFVATDPDEDGHRTLGRVRDLLTLDGDALTTLFKRMLKSEHHAVRSTGARCLQKEEKLLANVLASVQAQTHFLDSPRIRDSLSSSDFTFEDLKTKPMSIYLVLPSDRLNAYGRWLRLLIQQALTVNARNIETKPEKSVLFILDEMPALGKLTMVEQAFGLMAGYGMQLWGICQDASQLKRIYGDGWETFVSNAGVIQYFGSRDKFTAEYFSSLCGVTTVWSFSTAVARAFGQTSGASPSSSTTNTNTDTATGTQRKLAYADELMRMPKDRQLVLIENLNPIMAAKQPWFENDDLKALGRNLHTAQSETDAA